MTILNVNPLAQALSDHIAAKVIEQVIEEDEEIPIGVLKEYRRLRHSAFGFFPLVLHDPHYPVRCKLRPGRRM